MRIEWYNPQNERYYLVDLYEDLLGDWIVLRLWRGSARKGNHKIVPAKSYVDGLDQIKDVSARRLRHGYTDKKVC